MWIWCLQQAEHWLSKKKCPSGDKVYFQRFWLDFSDHQFHLHVIEDDFNAPLQDLGDPPPVFETSTECAESVTKGEKGYSRLQHLLFLFLLWCEPLHLQVQCCEVSTSSVFSSDGDSLMVLLKLFSPVELEFVPSTESSACSINADPPDSSLSPGFSSIKVELFFIHLLNIFTDAQTSRTWPSNVLWKILLVLVPPYRPMDGWAVSRFLATL